MRLFSKSRLAVSMVSVALAAAVLLTGCGDDSGGNPGGDTGGGDTGTVEPAPEPEPEPTPEPEPEPEPEPVEEAPETPANPGESVTSKSGMEMKVYTEEEGNKVNTVEVKGDESKVYAPFNFEVKNTSDKAVDLKEQTQTATQKARNLIATFATDEENDPYADMFDGSKMAVNFKISLDGKSIKKSDTACVIQVYDKDGNEKSGTILEPGERAEFKVVVKVSAEWADSEKPIKVEYTMPAQEDSTAKPVAYSFAVTADGSKPNYTAFPTISMLEGYNRVYKSVKATVNGQDGYLVVFEVSAENTTSGKYHTRNTVSELGGIDLWTALDGVAADSVMNGNAAQNIKAEVTTNQDQVLTKDVITAVDADNEAMAVMQTSNVCAYVFVPSTEGQWTQIRFEINGEFFDYAFKQTPVEETPEEKPAAPQKEQLKVTAKPEAPQAVKAETSAVNGYVVSQQIMIENISNQAVTLDGFVTYEQFMSIVQGVAQRYAPAMQEEYDEAEAEIAARTDLTDEQKEELLNQTENEINMKYMDPIARDAYQVAKLYRNQNVQVASTGDAWAVTVFAEAESNTVLNPGERASVMVLVYSSNQSNLLGMYHGKQLFRIEENILANAQNLKDAMSGGSGSETPDEDEKDDWTQKEDDDKETYTKYPTYFIDSVSYSASKMGDDAPCDITFEANEGTVRNTTKEMVDFGNPMSRFLMQNQHIDASLLFPEANPNQYVGDRMLIKITFSNGESYSARCVTAVSTATGTLDAGAAAKIIVAAKLQTKEWISDMTRVELYDISSGAPYCVFRSVRQTYSGYSAAPQKLYNELRPVQ